MCGICTKSKNQVSDNGEHINGENGGMISSYNNIKRAADENGNFSQRLNQNDLIMLTSQLFILLISTRLTGSKVKKKPSLNQKARLVMNVNKLANSGHSSNPSIVDGHVENGKTKLKASHSRTGIEDSVSMKSYESHRTGASNKDYDEGTVTHVGVDKYFF